MLFVALLLAGLIGLEGLLVALFPKGIKSLIEGVDAGLLRAAGLAELALAAAAVIAALTLGGVV